MELEARLAEAERALAVEVHRREVAEASLHHAERLATVGELVVGVVHVTL